AGPADALQVAALQQRLQNLLRRSQAADLAADLVQVSRAIQRFLELPAGLTPRGDVAKDEHRPDDLAERIPDRRPAVVDGNSPPIPRDEQRVLRDLDDLPAGQHATYGAGERLTRFLVQQRQNIVNGLADGLLAMPRGERPGDVVHEG